MDLTNSANTAAGQSNSSDFVRKLFKMLEDPTYRDIVRWNETGDSFIVLDTNDFTKNILPRHFKHSNFASFVRQLNKYDFHKVRNTDESGSSQYADGAWEFHHPYFQSNNKELLDNIKRKAPAPRKAASQPVDENGAPGNDDLAMRLQILQSGQEDMARRVLQLSTSYNLVMSELQSLTRKVEEHSRLLSGGFANRRFPGDNGLDPSMRPHPQMIDNGGLNMQHRDDGFANSHSSSSNNAAPNQAVTPIEQAQRFMKSGTDAMPKTMRPTPVPNIHMGQEHVSPHTSSIHNNAGFMYQPGTTFAVDNTPPNVDSGSMLDFHPDPQFGLSTLPNDNLVARRGRPNAARKKSQGFNPIWQRRPRILLVEDDLICRRIGVKFLNLSHCDSDTSDDGLMAIAKVNAAPPGEQYDLILMDIIMPNLDGVNACKIIRQSHPDMRDPPVIAMTSNIRTDDINTYFNNGMIDVLPKPFTKEGLLSMLQKHLSKLVASASDAGDAPGDAFDPTAQPIQAQPNQQPRMQTQPPSQSAHGHSFSQSQSEYHPFHSASDPQVKLSDSPTAGLNVFGETTNDDDEDTTGHSGNTPETSLGISMATGMGSHLDTGLGPAGDEYTYMNAYNLSHDPTADMLGAAAFAPTGMQSRRFMHEMEDFESRKRPKFAGAA